MHRAPKTSSNRLLDVLEGLLEIPSTDLKATLSRAADLMAGATGADKVDAFLYDPSRDTLVATGSNQRLSALQRQHGLDVLQVANGGRVVHVFKTGQTFVSGHVDEDPEELRGIKEALGICSKLGVPLEVGGVRRGMMMLASLQPEFFTEEDVSFAESVVRWIGIVAHRAELVEEISRNAMEQGRRAAAEELITVLAHDLRNLLAPIEMRLHGLKLRAERDRREEEVRDIELTQKSLGRLSSLVSDILDVSRLDEGMFRFEPEPVDLAALAAEVAGLFWSAQQPVEVRVQASVPLRAAGHAGRLRQCFENLIANALQSSPKDAGVLVLLRNERRDSGEWAIAEVIDEGPGIPEDLLPHIFDRFATGRLPQGGTGLGLYLARRIAQAHGGELEVESAPGKGARFRLSLPCLR